MCFFFSFYLGCFFHHYYLLKLVNGTMAVSSAWHDLCFETKHNSWGIDCCTCRSSHSVNSLFCFGWWVLGPIIWHHALKQVLLVHCLSLLGKKIHTFSFSWIIEDTWFWFEYIDKFQISDKGKDKWLIISLFKSAFRIQIFIQVHFQIFKLTKKKVFLTSRWCTLIAIVKNV